MARARRILLGGLGVGLSIALLIGLRQAGPHAAVGAGVANAGTASSSSQERGREAVAPTVAKAEPGSPSGPSAEAEIAEFLGLLSLLRQNDESVVPAMQTLAKRLCSVHDRCDGKDILAFYLVMTPEDRARGMEEQQRFDEIESIVRKEWNAGLGATEWAVFRDGAVDVLQGIAGRSMGQADVFPGACALGLCARLETDRVLADRSLDELEREELLAAARNDALGSLQAFERCGMIKPRIEPIWLLGYIENAAGRALQARLNFEECLSLARQFRYPEWQEKAIQGLVRLAKKAGDLHEVGSLLNELASLRTPDESWFLVREQAALLLQQDLARSTSEFLLTHRPQDAADEREWHILLGSAYLRQNDLVRARDEYALARPPPFSRDVALGMASVDLRAGHAQRVLEQLSKPEFLRDIQPFEEALALYLCGEAAMALDRHHEAASSFDRALQIGGDIQARLAPQRDVAGAATSVVGEGIGLHALALLAVSRVKLGDHLEAARAIESWQSRTLRGMTGASPEISTEDLISWARSTELGLVTWVIGADSSVVAHVSPDGSAEAVPIGRGRRSIEAAVRRLGEATLDGDSALTERVATQIATEILPAPISARIASLGNSDSKRLLLLVHGPLERLSFEYLFRDMAVTPLILPGLPASDPGDPIAFEDVRIWSILGNPVDSEGRSLLPGAREELAAIAALHRSGAESGPARPGAVEAVDNTTPGMRLHIGSNFDRLSLTEALRGSSPVHIATHLRHGCGREAGRLADVGLELSGNDALCAREILECKPRLPLVVLSACETAEGRFVDAEGLQGVSRAFLESGTRNLLVTLWPVEDQAARRFAQDFHGALLAGKRPSEAAAVARTALRSSGRPPADWAAFRLVGRD